MSVNQRYRMNSAQARRARSASDSIAIAERARAATETDGSPVGQAGAASRRVVLSAGCKPGVAARYRLGPLPVDPGDGASLRAFRAYRLPQAERPAGAHRRAGRAGHA